jgi:hypothetical protein
MEDLNIKQLTLAVRTIADEKKPTGRNGHERY